MESFGSLRKSSAVFENLQKSYKQNGNLWKVVENFFIYWTKERYPFGAVFVFFWIKFTVTEKFLLLVSKCLKSNCSVLHSQKFKGLMLSRYPHSDPLKMFHGILMFMKIIISRGLMQFHGVLMAMIIMISNATLLIKWNYFYTTF